MGIRALFNAPITALVLPLVVLMFLGLAALIGYARRVNKSVPGPAKSQRPHVFRRAA